MSAPSPRSVTALLRLDPDELRAAAATLCQPPQGHHWSQLAVVVGRIEREELYRPIFASARAYCAEVLGLPPRDAEEYVKLWDMMATRDDAASIARWELVPKSHAILMRQLLALGASLDDLLDPSRSFTVADLQAELDRRRGRDPWQRLEFDVPAPTATLIEQALTLAIGELGLEAVGLDALTDRQYRHQLLEAVARAYIYGRVSPEPPERDLLSEAVLELAHALVRGPAGREPMVDLSSAVADLVGSGWRPGGYGRRPADENS